MSEAQYEVCVVGAGVTGLNAVAVSADYLTAGERLLLVDSRPRVGGMWVDTYDYVRLHQPHGNFTAGNIGWNQGHKRDHLATKPEVLQHLERCLDTARRKVDLDELFGWDYVTHDERSDGIVVTLRSADQTRTVRTKRLIKAFGHRTSPNPPLRLSSQQVRSATPETLGSAGVLDSTTPVWIIGCGKTAMDTTLAVLRDQPHREVNLAAGPGTIFTRREAFFPTGARRWFGGTRMNAMVRDAAMHFDGTNEDELRRWFRTAYGTSPFADPTEFFGANLSGTECDAIERGVRSIEMEYLADVVDGAAGPELCFRSGRRLPVPAGSVIMNCTGGLLRSSHPYEPFASASGNVISIQLRSSITGVLSTFGGYYLPHLMFRDRLSEAGLYEMDVEELSAHAKPLVMFASFNVAMLNLGLMSEVLPPKVMLGCGLDFDNWYPMPRRVVGATKFMLTQRQDRLHHIRTLETLSSRFGVRIGPLHSEQVVAS